MPRKPTIHSRQAREALIALAGTCPQDQVLPPVRQLAVKYDIHPATVFRILRDLVSEGFFWQSPSGRFFPLAARSETIKGLPVCFIGREMWRWSRLYQEVLEGISEVCAVNGSPLILLSSRSLVRQSESTEPPEFASSRVQSDELQELVEVIPRGCAGFLLDHLWCSTALESVKFPGGEKVQLLHGDEVSAEVIAPDYRAAAEQAAAFATGHNAKKVGLVVPFAGDPAIDAAVEFLRESLAAFVFTEFAASDLITSAGLQLAALKGLDLLVCPEDNIALSLVAGWPVNARKSLPLLLGTQGTGILNAPHARLRIDYRRLGRAAASRVLHGSKLTLAKPHLVVPETDG